VAKGKFVSSKTRSGSADGAWLGGGEGPAYFLIAQLAQRWALSERQVHRFIAGGDLLATRFGRSVRISAEEVARFEAERSGK
jgi:excisionase family DNA binding protein